MKAKNKLKELINQIKMLYNLLIYKQCKIYLQAQQN